MLIGRFFSNNKCNGFTLIELLLVILIIGILGSIIFVGIGNQRKNARVNGALQTAESALAIGRECYFRLKGVSTPNDATNPTNEICSGSRANWGSINVQDCVYDTTGSPGLTSVYSIVCTDAGKRIVCGVAPDNGGCKVEDLP